MSDQKEYHNLTWRQFKEVVDAQLKEQGVSQDTEVWYIDISFPDNRGNKPHAWASDDSGIAIG